MTEAVAPPRPHYGSSRPASNAPPPGSESWLTPWVQIKYFSFHPSIFPNMIRTASSDAAAGDLVYVYDKEGNPFGAGFYNPKARIPLRILNHIKTEFTEASLDEYLDQAIKLRTEMLKPGECSDAWRVIHSDGDRLSGLVVDKYGDMLSIEVTSLGAWRRLRRWLPMRCTQHSARSTTSSTSIPRLRASSPCAGPMCPKPMIPRRKACAFASMTSATR